MDLDVIRGAAEPLPTVGIHGSELATLPDGTLIGIMMAMPQPQSGRPCAKLMVAPGGGKDFVGWIEVGSTIRVPGGMLAVTSIVLPAQGGPSIQLTPVAPRVDG